MNTQQQPPKHHLRLYKKQKLCNVNAIGRLFDKSSDAAVHSALCYPLRAVWAHNPVRHADAPIQFLISVPKKRLRHAVDRVTMRRRTREAFRLTHQNIPFPANARVDVAFSYVSSKLEPYARVQRAMQRLLAQIAASQPPSHENTPQP